MSFSGVPVLLEAVNFGNAIIEGQRAIADAPVLPDEVLDQRWGLYETDGETLVLRVDTVLAVDHDAEFRLSGAPLERGSFATYNKVRSPYRIRARVAYSGQSIVDRQAFLVKLDQALKSLDLYHFVTPEITYINANVTRCNIRRDENTGTMIVADLLLEEVRIGGEDDVNQKLTALSLSPREEARPASSLGQVQPLIPSLSDLVKASDFPELAALPLDMVQDIGTGLLIQSSGQVDRILSARAALSLIPGLNRISLPSLPSGTLTTGAIGP